MEKDIAVDKARPASTSSDENIARAQDANDPKWQPGLLNRFPWIGFGALVMILVCSAASVIVLATSDHVSVSHWPQKIAPNVLLNIMNNVANICFTIAIGNGIAIAWWRKAIQGSSIADLNRSWKFSTSISELVFSLRFFNIIALAALAAKCTIIDGTLMQRATDTYLATEAPRKVANVTGFVNVTFPITGTVAGLQEQPGLMEHSMGDTLKMWSKMGGIYPNQWQNCDGVCFLHVPALGFAFDCDDQTQESINNGQTLAQAFANGQNETISLFEITFNTKYINESKAESIPIFGTAQSSSYLEMNVSYADATNGDQNLSCPGTKFSQTCKLWPALVKYPVLIQNTSSASTVSIGGQNPLTVAADSENLAAFNQSGNQQNGFEVLQQIPILESHATAADNVNSSLSGIQLGLMMYIRSRSMLNWDNSLDGSFVIDQMGHAANFMTDPPSEPRSCAYQYSNPLEPYSAPNGLFRLPSIVGKINQIMFGLSTDVSRDDPYNNYNDITTFDATQYQQTIHYLTHYEYMWGAIAATIICVLLVLPVYWGFWQLGRKVSLNPFEIAYAFRSPVISQASTAATDELMKEVGEQKIRYGQIVAGEGRGRFGIDQPQNVAQAPSGKSN